MHLEVLCQVVGAGEPLLAHLAPVRLDPVVRPLVPGQLVRAGEAPVALWPPALEGLLPGVAAGMRLQVAGLGVQFGAVGERAGEDLVGIQ